MDEPPEVASVWGYRAHLDGLRALAVYLVVAFHSGVDRFSGGFVGVDVFFVLSGYLVTNLLIRDLEGAPGRIRFGRFYSRRARRLLPAAALNLVVTAIVFAAIAAPVELSDAKHAIRAASLYFANWFYIGQAADYFAADINASPVVHYWSLSVEEQFYLAWPLLLTGLYALTRRVGRHRQLLLRLIVAVAGLTSLAFALHLAGPALNRAYYGTDTRAYQLLAGALLALTPAAVSRARRHLPGPVLAGTALVLLGALGVIATSLIDVNPIQRGLVVTLIAGALIATLEAGAGGPARRILSLPPVVYLGKISYGTYLWHWLVIVVLARKADLDPLATAALAAVLATGLASLSYQLLEQPIRTAPNLDRLRPVILTSGLTLSLLVGLLVAPQILNRGGHTTEAATAQTTAAAVGGTPVGQSWKKSFFDIYDYGSCKTGGPVACPIRRGTGPKLMIVGDSHAGMYTPMIKQLAERHDLDVTAGYLPYCPWTEGIKYAGTGPNCFSDQDDLFNRILPGVDPDIVVLVHRTIDDVNGTLPLKDRDLGLLIERDPRREGALRRRITAVVDRLRGDGRKVVMIEPVPVDDRDHNPLTCLSKAKYVEQCRFVTSTKPTGEERIMRSIAAKDPDVVSVDFDHLACPYDPICDPVVGGLIVRHDDNHLTVTFAKTFLEPFEKTLVDNGILSRRPTR